MMICIGSKGAPGKNKAAGGARLGTTYEFSTCYYLYWGIGDFGNSSNVIGTWVAQVIMRYYSAPFDALLIKMVQD